MQCACVLLSSVACSALHYYSKLTHKRCYFRKKKSLIYVYPCIVVQGDSVARGPKLLSIKNYVIEIMTWKFIYTYRERCKTRPAHNRCWNWSPVTSKYTWMRFSKFWNTFPKLSTLTASISWRIAFRASSDRITLYMRREENQLDATECCFWCIWYALDNVSSVASSWVSSLRLKKVIRHKNVFWFSTELLSGIFLIVRRIGEVWSKSVDRSSCKVHVIIFRFSIHLN